MMVVVVLVVVVVVAVVVVEMSAGQEQPSMSAGFFIELYLAWS